MVKQGPKPVAFTPEQEQALALFFENRHPYPKVAEIVGVSTRTIERWATDKRFKQRLEEMRANLAESLARQAYIDKASRLIALSQMAESAREEYEARTRLKEFRPVLVKRPAETSEESDKPGQMQMVEDYIITEHFNADAYAAWRQTMADIAAELGARKNVTELTGKNGEPLPGLIINVPTLSNETKAKYMRKGTRQADDDTIEGEASDGSSSGSKQQRLSRGTRP